MATSTAVGGSQIDVRSLASQLVAADRATADQQIARQSARVTTQISALGQLMGSMSTFRSALTSLKTVDAFSTRSAVSGNKEVFTVSAGSASVPGTYEVSVQQLAKAHQISSNPFAGGSGSTVGTGTLTLSLGSSSFSVEITSENSTLAGIRDAINGSSDNVGVRATIVQGTDGARLVLSSSRTGEANNLAVAQTGGDGGLSAVAFSADDTSNYTVIAAAQDAIVNIAGAESRSGSNVIDGVVDGVTLTLLKTTAEDETVSLTIGYDSAAATKKIEGFVSAYNALATQMAKLRSYSPGTNVAGPMIGDSLLSSIESELRRALAQPVDGQASGFQTLAAIGITTQRDGTLAIDSTKLQKALTDNFDAVGKLFGSESGIAANLYSKADARLQSGGGLDTRSKALTKQQESIVKRKDDLDARMEAKLQVYIMQFTRLDTMLSQMQVTSSYMSQQIESLQNLNKK
ncbi:MAG TPA: flagellar filament capping protein FliD [Povalibacter sp.]|uniref:flagellar filament capping protein FliD n=1 Tax=Povalibacter sp. TaxID=1962978 RepID=UPI002C2E257C|nr:flagellar filament capping protein FliD [Povalibacter sp.]HMN44438.1 flagellar filament capping protein FliD [Povalibacter sp.]